MKGLTIKKQLFLFALVMLAFQALIAGVGYRSLYSLQSNLYSVFKKRLPSIDNLVQADRDYQQALVAERTLLIEGLAPEQKVSLAEEYKKNRGQVSQRFEVYKMLATSPEEKELIVKFEKNLEKWASASDSLLGINEKGEFKSADRLKLMRDSLGKVSEEFENSRTQLDMLQEHVQKLGASEFAEAVDKYESAENFIMLFSATGLILSLVLSYLVAQGMSGRIEGIVKAFAGHNLDLNRISGDLQSKSSSLAEVSQEQAASVTETSSSLHEISQMVANNSSNSVKSETLVRDSEVLIQKGIEIVSDLKESINGVKTSSEGIMSSVEKNNRDLEMIFSTFEEIKTKTNVINDIVFQTKLLSFNASVEAARAGEHGKGFAVVAEEIGNLAQESGSSAQEITEMLEGSLGKVSSIIEKSKVELEQSVLRNKEKIETSVEFSQRCHNSFNEIMEKFKSVAEAASEVVSASREQESGVAEINKAMQEIDSSNSITSESANAIAHSSHQLGRIVGLISGKISGLESLVGPINGHAKVNGHAKAQGVEKEESEGSRNFDDEFRSAS